MKSKMSAGLWPALKIVYILSALVFIFFMTFSFTAQAQSSFTASVDKDQVSLGDYFQLTFTFEGSQGGKNFHPPSFNDFMVLSGPNQSTRMQIVNGSVSSSISYSYILQPRDEGKFTIGAASIENEGRKFQTQPIAIEVVKGTAQPRSKRSENENPDVRGQIGNNLMKFIPILLSEFLPSISMIGRTVTSTQTTTRRPISILQN